MSNNTHRLLTALAALKGKMPHEVWPEWYRNYTTKWESDIWSVSGKKYEKRYPCEYHHTGPDLYAPDVTLDDLLRAGDAMGNFIDLAYVGGSVGWMACGNHDNTDGHGPTRHAAVRNALERAAGVNI